MSDFKLPELPSDEELGIAGGDEEGLELPEEGPELSPDEVAALLGESPARAGGAGSAPEAGGGGGTSERSAARAEAPRSRWWGPVSLAALVTWAWLSSMQTGLPRPVPANAADTSFSSARAMAVLVGLARAPHPIGSPEHTRVREALVTRLRSLGLDPDVQTGTAVLTVRDGLRAATVRNVVARIPGADPTGAVLVTAHYDGAELAPAAGDAGSGVAAILEAVRAARAGAPLRNDLIILFTDGEEIGLMGARAFMDGHPWAGDVSVVLSFEMRGASGPSLMFETRAEDGWIVRELREGVHATVATSLGNEFYEYLPNGTDFTIFTDAGVQGLNFAAIGRGRVYHEPQDVPENLSEATLQHHGLHALGMIRRLGNADLAMTDGPNAVFFDIPFAGLMVYDARWVLPLGGLLLVLATVAFMLARQRGARTAGIVVGLGLSIVSLSLAYALGVGLQGWLTGHHPEAGSLPGALVYGEGWHVLALAAAAFTLVTALHAVARRWTSLIELSVAWLMLPLIGSAWLALFMPRAAMVIQWPLVSACLAVAVAAALGGRAGGGVGRLAALIFALPVLTLMVPVVEILWLGFAFRLAGAVAVAAALTFGLILPALDGLRHPNASWAPLTAALIAVGAFLGGEWRGRIDAGNPAPSTLVYAYDRDAGTALWATYAAVDSLDLRARLWATAATGSTFDLTDDLRNFGYLAGDVPATTAPVVDAAPPAVQIVSDSTAAGTRNVRVTVRSEIGAEMIRFQRGSRGTIRFLAINDHPVANPEATAWIEHWGVPDSVVLVDVSTPEGSALDLEIVEHLLRPGVLLGPEPFRRPPGLTPDVMRMSDRAMLKSSILPPVDPGGQAPPEIPPAEIATPPSPP